MAKGKKKKKEKKSKVNSNAVSFFGCDVSSVPKEREDTIKLELNEYDRLMVLDDVNLWFGGYRVRKDDVVKFLRYDDDGDLIVEKENGETTYIKPNNFKKITIPYSPSNEMLLEFDLRNETNKLFDEIMNYHKENIINNCLENRDYEPIKKVI